MSGLLFSTEAASALAALCETSPAKLGSRKNSCCFAKAAIDEFFQDYNDLVVNSRNVWSGANVSIAPLVERSNLLLITPADSGFEVPEGPLANLYGVRHTNLFEVEQTRELLVRELRRPV